MLSEKPPLKGLIKEAGLATFFEEGLKMLC